MTLFRHAAAGGSVYPLLVLTVEAALARRGRGRRRGSAHLRSSRWSLPLPRLKTGRRVETSYRRASSLLVRAGMNLVAMTRRFFRRRDRPNDRRGHHLRAAPPSIHPRSAPSPVTAQRADHAHRRLEIKSADEQRSTRREWEGGAHRGRPARLGRAGGRRHLRGRARGAGAGGLRHGHGLARPALHAAAQAVRRQPAARPRRGTASAPAWAASFARRTRATTRPSAGATASRRSVARPSAATRAGASASPTSGSRSTGARGSRSRSQRASPSPTGPRPCSASASTSRLPPPRISLDLGGGLPRLRRREGQPERLVLPDRRHRALRDAEVAHRLVGTTGRWPRRSPAPSPPRFPGRLRDRRARARDPPPRLHRRRRADARATPATSRRGSAAVPTPRAPSPTA